MYESIQEFLDREDIYRDPSTHARFPRTLLHKHKMKFVQVHRYNTKKASPDDRFHFVCILDDCAQEYHILRWRWEKMMCGVW